VEHDLPPDDLPLITATLAGDTRAFSDLVLRHQWAVRAFLLARLAQRDAAEDLAQETFVLAWQKLREFDTSRPFVPWLRGIAENLLRNHLRKFKEPPIGGDEALQAMLDARLEEMGQGESGDPRAAVLGECLSRIDGPSSQLLTARYVEGKSLAELCDLTGRKHSALTMQLHRLRVILADCIERKTSA
jgi:RNA polymerase sigma-70 factor (ECF subfamily)